MFDWNEMGDYAQEQALMGDGRRQLWGVRVGRGEGVLQGWGWCPGHLLLQDLQLLPLQHLQVPVVHGLIVIQGHHEVIL